VAAVPPSTPVTLSLLKYVNCCRYCVWLLDITQYLQHALNADIGYPCVQMSLVQRRTAAAQCYPFEAMHATSLPLKFLCMPASAAAAAAGSGAATAEGSGGPSPADRADGHAQPAAGEGAALAAGAASAGQEGRRSGTDAGKRAADTNTGKRPMPKRRTMPPAAADAASQPRGGWVGGREGGTTAA
jgi:hypothetical protein